MFWRKKCMGCSPLEHKYGMSMQDYMDRAVNQVDEMLQAKCADYEKQVEQLYIALEAERGKVKALQECIRGEGK